MVKDANGLPVPDAELAVVVVDEAILALTNYQLSDPLSVFYADRPSYLSSIYSRASIILADPQALARSGKTSLVLVMRWVRQCLRQQKLPCAAEAPAATMTAEMPNQPNQPSIALRTDFNPLATFAPTVRTGFNGEARVFIKLPDNLTRYRVMVVAVDRRWKSIRHRRIKSHGATAAHGASICAALPQLWR